MVEKPCVTYEVEWLNKCVSQHALHMIKFCAFPSDKNITIFYCLCALVYSLELA